MGSEAELQLTNPRKLCMYRRTTKYTAARIDAMRAGRERARAARGESREPAQALPELRMRITVERLDFGLERHVFELHRTRRIDVYRVTVDGRPWRNAGLTAVLAALRKACPRVLSERGMK